MSAAAPIDRIESLSSGELSRSVSHEDTLNLVTPRTQEAFADAIRNVSAEELAMLETPRRGSIEITSLQRVESVALQSDAPQIPTRGPPPGRGASNEASSSHRGGGRASPRTTRTSTRTRPSARRRRRRGTGLRSFKLSLRPSAFAVRFGSPFWIQSLVFDN